VSDRGSKWPVLNRSGAIYAQVPIMLPVLVNPVSPTVNKRTTLKDALSMMLDADVQTGIVVDRAGAVQGLLTVAAIATKMREGEHAPAFDDLGALGEAESEAGPGEIDPNLDAGAADQAAIEQGTV